MFQADLQRTFTLYAQAHGVACPTDFRQAGFQALSATYQLRNRLMHPRSAEDFYVTDTEKQTCAGAAAWLRSELKRLIDAGDKKLQTSGANLRRTSTSTAQPRLAPC